MRRILLMGWVLVLWARPVFGQLTLEAVSPADGAVAVGQTATISFTFSEAVDTTAAFALTDGFYLAVELFPDPGDPLDIRLSADGRTVSVDLSLAAGTQYVGILSGARGQSGAALDRPHVVTFTTAATLPTATVSGTVSFTGGDPTGAVVHLFARLAEENLFDDNGPNDLLAAAVVTDASGAFTARFVPPADYDVGASLDLNGDGTVDDFFADAAGFYENTGDAVVDPVTVADGAEVTGIDVTMAPVTPQTARAAFAQAGDAAGQALPGAVPVLVAAEVNPAGLAGTWIYAFADTASGTAVGVITLNGQAAVGAFTPDPGDPFLGTRMAVPEGWIDSDQVLALAGAGGGDAFLSDHPDARLTAVLSFPEVGGEVRPAWLTVYETEGDALVLAFDPLTGEALPFGPPAVPASNLIPEADAAAAAWAADARLVAVGVADPAGIDAGGMTALWSFTYYAPAQDQARSFFPVVGAPTGADDVDPQSLPSLDGLPPGWIDSPAAAAVAEAHSDGFRTAHPDALVTALLTRGLLPEDPARTLWRFIFFSGADNALATVDVDALDGSLVVGLETADLPGAFRLDPGYPNPFRARTTLGYALPAPGPVTLAVYTATGQRVRTLVQAVQPAGTYAVPWDGRDDAGRAVAAGVYLCRLRAGSRQHTRVLVRLR